MGGWAGERVGGCAALRAQGEDCCCAAACHVLCAVRCVLRCTFAAMAPARLLPHDARSFTCTWHMHSRAACRRHGVWQRLLWSHGSQLLSGAGAPAHMRNQASQPASQRWTAACTASMCGSGRDWSCGLDICDWVCVCRVAALKFLCCHTFPNCLAAGLRPGRGARSRPWQPAAWRSRRCRRWRSAS